MFSTLLGILSSRVSPCVQEKMHWALDLKERSNEDRIWMDKMGFDMEIMLVPNDGYRKFDNQLTIPDEHLFMGIWYGNGIFSWNWMVFFSGGALDSKVGLVEQLGFMVIIRDTQDIVCTGIGHN